MLYNVNRLIKSSYLGHGGRNCEEIVDPCTNFTNPCQNNANCTEDPRDPSIAVCLCSRDFYGRKCEKGKKINFFTLMLR